MSKADNKDDIYKFIVRENIHRLTVLKNFDNPFPDDKYNLYYSAMKDFTIKIIKRVSYSTNFVRKRILKDDNVVSASYHLSKLRIDYYNGNYSQYNNTNSIFNILRTIDTGNYKYYFVTIDYLHMSNFLNISAQLQNMKYIIKNFIHTNLFTKISGMIVKYETNWNLYDKKLYLTPHYHLIIKLNNNLYSNVLEDLQKYFSNIVLNPEKDINIKPITDNEKSYYNISKYIAKDVYYRVFHFIDNNKNVDTFQVPYSDITFLAMSLNNIQVFNSYKDLHFKLSYR